jgi:hypothetical protein
MPLAVYGVRVTSMANQGVSHIFRRHSSQEHAAPETPKNDPDPDPDPEPYTKYRPAGAIGAALSPEAVDRIGRFGRESRPWNPLDLLVEFLLVARGRLRGESSPRDVHVEIDIYGE